MRLNHEEKLQLAEEYARELFLKNPNLPVNTAARLIHEECDRSLIKPSISRIRRSVREELAMRQGNAPEQKLVENRPTIVPSPLIPQVSAQETVKAVPMAEIPVNPNEEESEASPAPPGFPHSTPKERAEYMDKFIANYPNPHVLSIDLVKTELNRKYGKAVGQQAMSDAVRSAKLAARGLGKVAVKMPNKEEILAQAMAQPLPERPSLGLIIETLKVLQIFSITLPFDGPARVWSVQEEKAKNGGK